ncbi:Formyltetrahydrofolate deformylase 2, mitochondrial [Asimina triloba]
MDGLEVEVHLLPCASHSLLRSCSKTTLLSSITAPIFCEISQNTHAPPHNRLRPLPANLSWFRRAILPEICFDARSPRFPVSGSNPSRPPFVPFYFQIFDPDMDSVGIVAKLSECIASRGGNINSVDVFVPENKQIFYSRSEFIFDPEKWPRSVVDDDFQRLSKMFNAERSVVRVPELDPKYKIVVLTSKQEHCLVDLLHGWQEGRLPVDINCVISNHERAPNTHIRRFLERHEIPYHFLPTAPSNKREEEILELVSGTDFLVLARYMQPDISPQPRGLNSSALLESSTTVLSGEFLETYGKDVINIHHGLLPSFKGGNPSKQAFDYGVKLIGATSHFVTEELDAGPIIEQMVERVSHRDNLRSFVQKSENLEKQCLEKAIKSYCELRVLRYEEVKTVVF